MTTSSIKRRIGRFHVVVVLRTSKKCTKKRNACAEQLFFSVIKQLFFFSRFRRLRSYLKQQYPVTAHAPNFDSWTGCREIKRCEESKRILKNPFASRLAGFNTTLKLLRIIDK